jgi:hypothetical protein
MPIRHYLNDNGVYSPVDIQAMSMALNDVCKVLRLDGNAAAKEAVAIRIVELARRGERNSSKLRDRVIAEANGETFG